MQKKEPKNKIEIVEKDDLEIVKSKPFINVKVEKKDADKTKINLSKDL